MLTGGGGVKNDQNLAYVICERSLNAGNYPFRLGNVLLSGLDSFGSFFFNEMVKVGKCVSSILFRQFWQIYSQWKPSMSNDKLSLINMLNSETFFYISTQYIYSITDLFGFLCCRCRKLCVVSLSTKPLHLLNFHEKIELKCKFEIG